MKREFDLSVPKDVPDEVVIQNNKIDLKKENNEYILIGERDGIKLPGFDYGNSPSQIEKVDFTNKVVVHTTSCGTQGIVNSKNAEEIITGRFPKEDFYLCTDIDKYNFILKAEKDVDGYFYMKKNNNTII